MTSLRTPCRLFVALWPLLAAVSWSAAADTVRRDGIVAGVTVGGDTANVSWRYEKSLAAPLRELVADFNGRALPLTSSQSYPAEGDSTALMFVVDITGGEAMRERTYRAKARLLRLYDSVRPHHVVALGAIDGGVRLVLDRGDEAPDPLSAMLQLRQTETPPELGTSLRVVIEALADQPAARRAAFVFTDGFSETRVDAQEIIDLARKSGVALNIIVEPSERPSDLTSLRRIADETGGVYAEGEAIAALLEAPFAFIDSGAYASIDLRRLYYYPWEDGRNLSVSFRYGDKTLDLSAPVAPRHATARESISYLWDHFGREVAVLAAGAGWAIALVGMAVGGSYRRRVRRARELRAANPPTPPNSVAEIAAISPDAGHGEAGGPASSFGASPALLPEKPVVAVASPNPVVDEILEEPAPEPSSTGPTMLRLHRPDGGHVDVPLEGEEISIGRGNDNDVVLKHPSVSTRHALLIRVAGGGYAIQNLSKTNPTRVAGRAIIHQVLSVGDAVEVGEIKAEMLGVEPPDSPETFA